jgi:hypothetical protein
VSRVTKNLFFFLFFLLLFLFFFLFLFFLLFLLLFNFFDWGRRRWSFQEIIHVSILGLAFLSVWAVGISLLFARSLTEPFGEFSCWLSQVLIESHNI